MSGIPSNLVVLPHGLTNAFRSLQDVPILHLAEVTKLNRRGKRQRRFVIITSTHLYSCMENGNIQRCLATRSIAEIHIWTGHSPQVGLKIPSEYDMLLFLNTSEDVNALVAALQSTDRDDSGCGGGGNCNKSSIAMSVVEATAPLDAVMYQLERPKGFQRTMVNSLLWSLGSVGEVGTPSTANNKFKPFLSNNTNDISLLSPKSPPPPPPLLVPPSSSLFLATAEGTNTEWNNVLPLQNEMLDATPAIRGSGTDYSDDVETDAGYVTSFSPAVDPPTEEERTPLIFMPSCDTKKDHHQNNNNNNNLLRVLELEGHLQKSCELLHEERQRQMKEREQWCLLLAAERRNTHQLRQAIADLRGQVFALSSQNLALRTELLRQSTD
ncbi:uncharacterized protein TM35_000791070 [Trypanosoma theileri]|uniref:TH1 domain-containing protein n=1 Tax=Trypanosoma theileri TaxID=67003 RepID=A0A1X0NEU8_9TRYP|nr:uncharacterized protein TM35_000791070 [Trypanosoma theileri]ORC82981.1 hypothetical protein TM35_000791070 [Trypanosoma theileri]